MPGLVSHPWSLSRLGSQGWSVVGLGRVPAKVSPHTRGPGVPAALCMGPLPPDPDGHACSERRLTAPRGGASGLEELWKVPGALWFLVVGFPPPASFLRVTPPTDGSLRPCRNWGTPEIKSMALHSSTLAWEIPWMEEPGRLQSMGSQRIGHDWAT